MAWDPTHPATGAGVVSAPLRDNFAALNTQLMAPLIAAPVEQVLKVGAGDTLAGITAGTNGQVLTLVAGAPSWSTPAFVSPMTAVGDVIRGTTAGAPQRLAIGTAGQVLTAVGGVPAWAALPVDPGFANPMTAVGDVITGATAGAAQRLAAVATGAVLASAGVGTVPTWNTTPTLTGLTLSSRPVGQVLFAGVGGAITSDSTLTFAVGTGLGVTGTIYVTGGVAITGVNDVSMNIHATGAGGHEYVLDSTTSASGFGGPQLGLWDVTLSYKQLLKFSAGADFYLAMWDGSAHTLRGAVQTGAADSGGAGYRMMRVPN